MKVSKEEGREGGGEKERCVRREEGKGRGEKERLTEACIASCRRCQTSCRREIVLRADVHVTVM